MFNSTPYSRFRPLLTKVTHREGKTTLIRMHFDAIHKATKGLMVYLWMQWWFSESRQMDSKWNSTNENSSGKRAISCNIHSTLDPLPSHDSAIFWGLYFLTQKCGKVVAPYQFGEPVKRPVCNLAPSNLAFNYLALIVICLGQKIFI